MGEKYLIYKYNLPHREWYLDVNNICIKIQPKIVQDEEKQANISCVKSLISMRDNSVRCTVLLLGISGLGM